MNNKLYYPAIFHTAEEGGFWVSFPDLPECLTEGDDVEQAYEMAVDALGLCIADRLNKKEALPAPSVPCGTQIDDGFLVSVEVDMLSKNININT